MVAGKILFKLTWAFFDFMELEFENILSKNFVNGKMRFSRDIPYRYPIVVLKNWPNDVLNWPVEMCLKSVSESVFYRRFNIGLYKLII